MHKMDFSFLLNYILAYPNVEQDIDEITSKKENLKKFSPLIFNRYLSFHSDTNLKNASFNINKYLFTIKDTTLLFKLMCYLTPSIKKTFIQYKSKIKKESKYDTSIIKVFKKCYGEYFSTNEITEIVDYVYKNDKNEFIKICSSNGMTMDGIVKMFPDTKEYINVIKIDASEKKQFVKFLKESNKTKKIIISNDIISDLDTLI